jgi:FkbM family methyltransferase
MKLDILQIGANVGCTDNDPVWPILSNNKNFYTILIEGNPESYKKLTQCYNKLDYPNTILLNCLVDNEIGYKSIFVDNFETENKCSQHSSMSYEQMIGMSYGGNNDNLTEVKNLTITINDIVNLFGINEIDWLYSDTEGNEYNILSIIDFSKINNINFEACHIDGTHKRGEKYKKLISYLEDNGFIIVSDTYENVQVKYYKELE